MTGENLSEEKAKEIDRALEQFAEIIYIAWLEKLKRARND